LENSPSNATADQPLRHFISIDAVVSAAPLACAASRANNGSP